MPPNPIKSDGVIRSFSLRKALLVIFFICAIGILFVRKEVLLDETMHRLRKCEVDLRELQVQIAEAQIEIDSLSSFPRITPLATASGFTTLSKRPQIVDISLGEMPLEFRQTYVPLNFDSIRNFSLKSKSEKIKTK
jgi:cell division protein FtsL